MSHSCRTNPVYPGCPSSRLAFDSLPILAPGSAPVECVPPPFRMQSLPASGIGLQKYLDSQSWAHGAVIAALVLAFVLKWQLGPIPGEGSPYLVYLPAVVIAAYFGGRRTGLLVTFRTGGGRARPGWRSSAAMSALRWARATILPSFCSRASWPSCAACPPHLCIWYLPSGKDVLELQASAGPYSDLVQSQTHLAIGRSTIALIASERKPLVTNRVLGTRMILLSSEDRPGDLAHNRTLQIDAHLPNPVQQEVARYDLPGDRTVPERAGDGLDRTSSGTHVCTEANRPVEAQCRPDWRNWETPCASGTHGNYARSRTSSVRCCQRSPRWPVTSRRTSKISRLQAGSRTPAPWSKGWRRCAWNSCGL